MTQNQKLYKKEINRIKKYISKKEKEGFIFVEFPEDLPDLSKMPKRVTQKTIENVKSITGRKLLVGSIFGETSGYKEMERRRKEAGRKAAITKKTQPLEFSDHPEDFKSIKYIPTFNFLDKIQQKLEAIERKAYPLYEITGRRSVLINTFEDTRNMYDEELLTDHFKKYEKEIAENIEIIEYASSDYKIDASFTRLLEIINIAPLSEDQLQEISIENEILNSYTNE